MAQPNLITVSFASNATPDLVNNIPIQVQPSDPENLASWEQGFPSITMVDQLSGGLPPFGQDFNGVFRTITENIRFMCGGGLYKFDPQWIDEVGGYDVDAILLSDDGEEIYRSKVNDNTVNPNTATGATLTDNWDLISSVEGIQRALVSIQQGIAGSQVRNNTQLDSRYVQLTGYNAFNPNGTYAGLRAQATTAADTRALALNQTTTYTRDLLTSENGTEARQKLIVLRAGTAAGEARTNAQNDVRFLQIANFDMSFGTAYDSVTSAWGRQLVLQPNAGDARDYLNLGTASTRNVGTGNGNVAEYTAEGLSGMGYGGQAKLVESMSQETNLSGCQFYRAASTNNTKFARPGVGMRMRYAAGVNFDLYGTVSGTRVMQYASDDGVVHTLWSTANLSDPARLGQAQTYTQRQTVSSGDAVAYVYERTGSNSNCSTSWRLPDVGGSANAGLRNATTWSVGPDGNLFANRVFDIDVTNGNTRVYGNLQVDGNINRTSDAKFKRVIGEVEVTQEQLDSIKLVEFVWTHGNKKGQTDTGFIAQDVRPVFPHCVTEVEEKDEDGNVTDTYLTVDYGKLAAHMDAAQRRLDRINRGA